MKPIFIAVALLLAPVFAGTAGDPAGKGAPAPPPVAPVVISGDVQITGSLAQHSVQVRERAPFWLTIHNRSSAPIFDVTLAPTGLAGFSIAERCWQAAPVASCVPETTKPTNAPAERARSLPGEEAIISEIEPGETLAIWGGLSALDRAERRTLYATVRWTNADGKPSQSVVALGDLAALDGWDAAKKVAAWIQAFLKDLALPILLVVLAALFKRWDDKREGTRRAEEGLKEGVRQQAEKDLENQRHKDEQERQQLFQTWNQMLRVSHDDATKHYMPILAAATTVRSQILKCREAIKYTLPLETPVDEQYKHALFYMLLMRKRNKRFADRRGGFYFKDRIGEALASACWSEANGLYIQGNEEIKAKFSELLKHVEPDDLLSTFMDKFRAAEQGSVYDVVHRQFCEWLKQPESGESMDYLQAFIAVVTFEMNKPYAYWYPADQKSKLNTPDNVEEILRDIAGDEKRNKERKSWQSDVEAYLSRSV